jgi:diguanylate cyclase (GGDEF)-like protein
MISLKKYLELTAAAAPKQERGIDSGEAGTLEQAVETYRSALREMGSSSVEACPSLGVRLQLGLGEIEERLSEDTSRAALDRAQSETGEQLRQWGRETAGHYRKKTDEVRDMLLAMAQTAESVGERDKRCGAQISEVTMRLKRIASLDDLTQIRASIEKSAVDLKTALERMEAEGRQAVAKLRAELASYQAKLEEAERIATRDALTGLRNRTWVERQIEKRINAGTALSVAVVDIDGFKRVNDEMGHVVGDDLLKQFAGELKSACRAQDLLGRWGGDEFILVFDSGLAEAKRQIERLRVWVCGKYPLETRTGQIKLKVDASMGLAEHKRGESFKDLLSRADAAMYECKSSTKVNGSVVGRLSQTP